MDEEEFQKIPTPHKRWWRSTKLEAKYDIRDYEQQIAQKHGAIHTAVIRELVEKGLAKVTIYSKSKHLER